MLGTRGDRIRFTSLALLGAALLGIATGSGASEPPALVFEGAPGYSTDIERLSTLSDGRVSRLMDLVGLRDGGDAIHVVLAPEEHPLARQVPAGVAGYAITERDLAVLLPERVPRYPYDSLEVLLLHEVTHVLASRAASGQPLPRWWSEGLALVASRGWSLEDRSRVVVGALSGVPGDVDALEASFDGGPYDVAAAYALSGALVHHLAQLHGDELVADTLARVAAGDDFDTAYAKAAGSSLQEDVAEFWRRYRLWYRWLPFLTSGAVLWGAITALALLAGMRRRQRDAAIRRRWDEEERLQRAAEMARDASETVH